MAVANSRGILGYNGMLRMEVSRSATPMNEVSDNDADGANVNVAEPMEGVDLDHNGGGLAIEKIIVDSEDTCHSRWGCCDQEYRLWLKVCGQGESTQPQNNGGRKEEALMRTITIGGSIEAKGSGEFCFGKKNMGLIEEEGDEGLNGIENLNLEEANEPVSPPLYLASWIRIDGNGFGSGNDGGGFDLTLPNFDENGAATPVSSKLLSAFADPEDGGVSLKYAKIEWQLHHDQGRALSKFEGAVQAAPQHSFLWEIDDDGEEDTMQAKHIQVDQDENLRVGNSITNQDLEKGDLLGAEEYYLRAVVADPGDGEIMSLYAKLVCELHQDHDKASSYFERAVQATPEDRGVLFIWTHDCFISGFSVNVKANHD
ncbi:hypothetical protein GH714_021744 [Hevea brasiliensis]|uniref:Uncharacterized protein n=1 Tax=Hevea brasiliensis TaxID=3981 RepID=A0A6A6MQ65_HEVBR|nr:hypothetical protein GH714_021744 [Hevea brasiliensis]